MRPSASRDRLGFLRTKVIDLELDGPLETVRGLHGYVFALVVVRSDGEPLGTVRVPVHGDECPSTVLADAIAGELGPALLRQRLAAILETPTATRRLDISAAVGTGPRAELAVVGSMPAVTVAVCTRDRSEQLRRCLTALSRLRDDIRVIVIDNAPSTAETARLVAAEFPQFDHVVEPRPGLDHARNRAIAETGTEVIAFTDDDAVVDERWTSALARAFAEEPGLAAVTGLVLPLELETPAQELFERLGGFGRGFRRRWETAVSTSGRPRSGSILGAGEFGTGANMAFRRSVFERVGGFDPALDVGTPTRGGGDLEMFHRVLACGECIRYEPSAIVFHQHRRTLDELRSQLYGNGGQWAMMDAAWRGRRTAARDVGRIARWYLTEHWPRQVVASVVVPNRVPLRYPLAEVEGMVAAAIGRWYRRSLAINPDGAAPPIPPGCIADPARQAVDGAVDVRTLDVAEEHVDDIDAADGPLSVLVTRSGAAIGRVDMETAGHRLSGRQLRERIVDDLGVRLLRECDRRSPGDVYDEVLVRLAAGLRGSAAEPPPPRAHTVSIVIATLDRPDSLSQCLDSLRRQRSRHTVEIVVVDNNPGSGLTAAVLHEHPDVVHVTETRRGLAYARNAGFRAATGEILVTTDDDVQVMPGWLDRLLVPFGRNDVMAVAGNVQPIQLRTPVGGAASRTSRRSMRPIQRSMVNCSSKVLATDRQLPGIAFRLGDAMVGEHGDGAGEASFVRRDAPPLGLVAAPSAEATERCGVPTETVTVCVRRRGPGASACLDRCGPGHEARVGATATGRRRVSSPSARHPSATAT